MTAARGGTTRITLPDGHALDVQIPAGTRDGQTIRLRGKGVTSVRGGPPGDLLCRVVVETPVNLTPRQKELLQELPVEQRT